VENIPGDRDHRCGVCDHLIMIIPEPVSRNRDHDRPESPITIARNPQSAMFWNKVV